jgi:deazaflavin-dependent oxidoreductase (nitroreductase family)
MANTEYLYLTTTGWKSGQAHEIEIWYVEHGGAYYLIAEHGEKAHWVQNIHHQAQIMIRLGDWSGPGTGRTIDRQAEPELAAAVAAKMQAKYQWSEGLIVELRPQA